MDDTVYGRRYVVSIVRFKLKSWFSWTSSALYTLNLTALSITLTLKTNFRNIRICKILFLTQSAYKIVVAGSTSLCLGGAMMGDWKWSLGNNFVFISFYGRKFRLEIREMEPIKCRETEIN